MRSSFILTVGLSLAAASLVRADGAFYGDPPDAHHAWAVHDMNRPQPPKVDPKPYDAEKAKAPADAVVLFSGADADVGKWESDKNGEPTKWIAKDGTFQCVPGSGYVRTKEKFGDCQLHVEWAAPTPPQGSSQGRGNSGIFLMGMVEIQVLDNYDNPTYPDGSACSMYGVNPPLANALRPPGEFQSIDITFRRPIWKDGKCEQEGYVTVYCNGVLMQDKVQIEGGTGHKGRSKPGPFPETGPLKFQDHGNPVRYRNVWIRPLPPRTADDKPTTVPLSEEATKAKRAEIARMIRDDAAKLAGVPQTLRLLESLCYEGNDAAFNQANAQTLEFVNSVKATPADKIESRKGDVMHVNGALQYLAKFNLVPAGYAPAKDLAQIVSEHDWDGKKANAKKK